MFIAMMDSETKTWIAKGKTEQDAKEALRKAWNKDQNRIMKYMGENGEIFIPIICKNTDDLDEMYGVSIFDLTDTDCVMY